MSIPEPDELDFEQPQSVQDLLDSLKNDPDTWDDPRYADSDLQVETPDYASDGSIWAPLRVITSTMNPDRPRTLMAGYDPKNYILTVQFRDTTVYNYYDVSPSEWLDFQSSPSKNDYISAVLNDKRRGYTTMGAHQAAGYKGLGRNAARYKKTMYPGTQRPYGGTF